MLARAAGAHTQETGAPGNHGTTYGTSGWNYYNANSSRARDRNEYHFRFDYGEEHLVVQVQRNQQAANGTWTEGDWQTVFDLTPTSAGLAAGETFPQGQIVFYGLSQPYARYSLIDPIHSICEAVLDIEITSPNEGGPSNDTTPEVVGTATPGASITVTVEDGTTTAPGCTTTADAVTGAWACEAGPMADGAWTITAVAVHPADPTVTGDDSVPYLVDTVTSGTIDTPENDTTLPGPVTAISGTGEPGATVVVTVDGGSYSTTVTGGGQWSVTIPGGLSNNDTYTADATFTDVAGNEASDTSTFTISACSAGNLCDASATCEDTTPTGFECVCGAGFVMVGAACVEGNIEITSPTPLTVTNNTTPIIIGTATPNTTVTVVIGGQSGTTSSDGGGNWSYTPSTPLTHGPHDIEASITLGGTDFTDNSSIIIDLETVVAISTPADGSTSATPITVVGGTGEPNATVTLTINGSAVPTSATVTQAGTWSITLTTPLLHSETPYTIIATAEDDFGNTDSDSSLVTVTLPIEVSVSAPTDGSQLNDSTPTVEGTATPGASVTVVFEDGVSSAAGCTDVADSNGDWSCTVAAGDALSDGDYTVVATATSPYDPSRTATDDSNVVTIDTETYVAITGPADQTTSTTSVDTITGTGEPGGEVTITLNGNPQLDGNGDPITVTVDEDGTWSFPLDEPIDDGEHEVTATITDPAGNTETTPPTEFSVVTAISVRIEQPLATSVSNPPVTAPVTVISGTGDADGVVTLTITGTGETTYSYISSPIAVDASGAWAVTLPEGSELLHGTYSIVADIEHELDSTITNSHSILLTVDLNTVVAITELRDAAGPLAPVAQGPLEEARGTTEPGNTVEVSITNATGDVVANGPATVAADGTWSFVATTPISDEGTYSVSATATNVYGLTAEVVVQQIIDTSIELEITSHTDGEEFDLPIASVGGTTDPEAEVTITVVGEDGVPQTYGPVVADENGDWSVTFPSPLPSGTWEITADAEDEAGNTATYGPIELSVTVNNCTDETLNTCDVNASCTPTGPGTHTCECNEGYEGDGESCVELPVVEIEGPADGSTVRTGTPVIEGTGTPETLVTIVITDEDGNPVGGGTTTTDEDGNWVWTPDEEDALEDGGPYTVTTELDLGNGTTPAEDSITIDVDLSTDIVIETPAEGETVTQTPTITGTAVPGAPVEISVGGTPVGTTTADDNGQWSFTVPDESKLPIGPATLGAEDVDNESTDDVNVIVERELVPVTITGPEDGSDTEETRPTVTGEGEPGTTVTIIVDDEPVGEVTVDENGTWTWTPDEDLSEGEHTIEAQGEDGSSDSITLTIVPESEILDEDLKLTGGRFFGCATGDQSSLALYGALAFAALLVFRRRRYAA